jgi:hypothetical protein
MTDNQGSCHWRTIVVHVHDAASSCGSDSAAVFEAEPLLNTAEAVAEKSFDPSP